MTVAAKKTAEGKKEGAPSIEGFRHLLSPIEIKGVEIPNRVALAPMNTMFSMDNRGCVNDQILAYYAARAKGGCGLIITECVLGTRQASRYPYTSNLHCFNVSHVPGLAELAETIHAFGSRVFIQMSIGFGRQGHAHDGSHPPAPSAIPYVVEPALMPRGFDRAVEKFPQVIPYGAVGHIPREMTIEEIHREQDEFANSCRLAVIAQFDGIELHAPHGYLEHQFLSPRSNRRTDMYGGSLMNRMRFLIETYMKVRESVGADYIVGVRLSADEHMPDGFTHEEAVETAKVLAGAGIDYVSLSDGSYEALKYFFPDRDGGMIDEAANFKKALDVPVMVPAAHDPRKAEKWLAEGRFDILLLGRQMFADPEWGNKVKDGRIKDINRCRRCNECLIRNQLHTPVRCVVNPDLGRERFMPEYWRPPVQQPSVLEARLPEKMPEYAKEASWGRAD